MKFALGLISICLYFSYTSANPVESSWKSIKTEAELNEHIKEADEKMIIIEFWGKHCGPCKMIAPVLEQLAIQYPNVVMIKVDVDEGPELAYKFHISVIPTFSFLKDGEPIEQHTGFVRRKFEGIINANSL